MSTRADKAASAAARGGAGLGSLTLLASAATLVCCALPIVLVTAGLGSAVAAITSAFPFLIVMSQYKVWLFAGSALLLGLTVWTIRRSAGWCPVDPVAARRCHMMRRMSRVMLWSSVVIWTVGFAAAYLALPVRIWLGV